MVDRAKITRFEDLEVWQVSQDLAVFIYTLTKVFPSDEKFGLVSQLRRAASSISANVAEGFGRHSQKDKLHFYAIAYGSTLEVKSFLYLSERLEFIDSEHLDAGLQKTQSCQKLLNALSASIKARA